MGVKGTCRSANGGGCPFLYARYISSRLSFAPASGLLRHSQGQKGIELGQKVAKVNIYFLAFVFSRDFRRQERAKSKHIFEIWYWRAVSCAPFVVCFIVSTWCRWCAPAPSLWVCSVPFSLPLPSFLLCLPCRLRIWLYFAF